MNKTSLILLVVVAAAAALAVSMHAGVRLLSSGNYLSQMTAESTVPTSDFLPIVSFEEACYPYRWQTAERERLQRLLEVPDDPPPGTDALALARYAEYARRMYWEDSRYEAVMREGMRRDPDNALYHYLLAYRQIKRSVDGFERRLERDGEVPIYDYTITDRALFDQAMGEVAAGMRLPYNSRRYELLAAQLDAMPRPRCWQDQLRETAVLAGVLFPEYAKMRTFARVNGFYLSVLLAEGKRAEAKPFLYTGDRLAAQIAGDRAPTLIGMLVALAVHAICEKNDAAICRRHGLTDEAAEIERRFEVVSGKMKAWKDSVRDDRARARTDRIIKQHGGIMASILCPIFGSQQWLTPAMLRPSRRTEIFAFTGFAVTLLPAIFIGLLLYSALKYWRWRLALAGADVPAHDAGLSAGAWARALLIGVLLPVILFAAVLSLTVLSPRGMDVPMAVFLFVISALAGVLWLLTVPTGIAAGAVWRRSLAAGAIEVRRPVVGALLRGFSAVGALVWAALALHTLLALPAGALLLGLTPALLPDLDLGQLGTAALVLLAAAAVLVGVALLPALWERHHPDCAQHFLTLARTMIPVYAVLALCTAALYPALLALETRALRQDTVMTTMRNRDTIAFTHAEGRLVLHLRETVLQGATQLEREGEGRADMSE